MANGKLISPIRWYGGKGNLAGKILPLIPRGGRPYVEPYCGGASIFFAKPPDPVEVLNDLNRDIVNLFRVLQDPELSRELEHRIRFTPYALAEFERALEIRDSSETNPVLRAWATFVLQNQGFGGKSETKGDWGRAFVSNRGMAHTCSKWMTRQELFEAWRRRLMRVQIDCRDALEVIRYWDSENTVFYLDPPYVLSTRKDKKAYAHEASDEHHRKLVKLILTLKGAVVLSGYENPIYQPLEEAGWEVIKIETACHAAGRIRGSGLQGEGAASKKVPRTEAVWLNPKCQDLLWGVKTISRESSDLISLW